MDAAKSIAIGIGIWLCVAGGVAALAGLSAIRRARVLRASGVQAWAVPAPAAAEDLREGAGRRPMIQYALADGRVIERACPGSLRKAGRLAPGERVLVWYDPADPGEILVYGRGTRVADLALAAAGVLCALTGAAIAVLVR
jgi:hypothetical protein